MNRDPRPSARLSAAGLALGTALVLSGCSAPTGPTPFRTMFRTIAGNYRPADLLDVPPGAPLPADGSDVRLSLGTRGSVTGRILLPASGIDTRLAGAWTFEDGDVIIDFSPESGVEPQRLILRVGFLGDRVGLTGAAGVGGTLVMLDLAKPLPRQEGGGGDGGGRIPSF